MDDPKDGRDLDDIPEFLEAAKRPPRKPPEPPKRSAIPAPAKKEGPETMRTHTETTKTPKRIPVPPPKAAKAKAFKDAGDLQPVKASKKEMRAVAEKAVKENPVTKVPPKGARKAAAPKAAPAPKAKAAPKTAGLSIGEIARQSILDGLSNEEALAKVKKAHPDGNTKLHNMSWYRMDLRRKGLLADTATGQKAAKKVEKAAARSSRKTKKAVAS